MPLPLVSRPVDFHRDVLGTLLRRAGTYMDATVCMVTNKADYCVVMLAAAEAPL